MTTKVFIDGSSGTTGLRIHERLQSRGDIEVIRLAEELRKDAESRRKALNEADIAFLCLPDAASIEAVSMIESDTCVIDTSTAFRTAPGWVYGFPELKGQRELISGSKRIANPGCHASGFIALVAPLVKAGIVPADAHLQSFSITGYSGGGKKMIAEYEETNHSPLLEAPRQYGISQNHKHLPEMQKVCGLKEKPIFSPIVAPYYSGMEVTVPLFASDIDGTAEEIKEIFRDLYRDGMVRYSEADEEGFLSAVSMHDMDDMEVTVKGNDERILLVSRFDNLGKGASGSAIQNMNIVMGIDEKTGLNTREAME